MTASTQNRFATNSGSSGGDAKKGGAGSKDGEAAADAKPKTKPWKNKKVIIAFVALLGIGYGVYSFLQPAPKPGPPVGGEFVAVEPNTLNLTDGHYLKIAVSVQLVAGKAKAADWPTGKAADLVIKEFSNKTVESMSSNADRAKLVVDLKKRMEKAYEGEVFDVFLTQFVTQ